MITAIFAGSDNGKIADLTIKDPGLPDSEPEISPRPNSLLF
jgi:hypothetical protein